MGVILSFEKYTGNVKQCLNLAIYHWLSMSEEDAPDKRETLFEALKTIKYSSLAEDLRRKYEKEGE